MSKAEPCPWDAHECPTCKGRWTDHPGSRITGIAPDKGEHVHRCDACGLIYHGAGIACTECGRLHNTAAQAAECARLDLDPRQEPHRRGKV